MCNYITQIVSRMFFLLPLLCAIVSILSFQKNINFLSVQIKNVLKILIKKKCLTTKIDWEEDKNKEAISVHVDNFEFPKIQ